MAVGVCTRILARRVGYKSEENAFTIGLLHDIGKSLLDKVDHDGFMQAIEKSRATKAPLWKVER